MCLQYILILLIKILFADHLKHSSYLQSTDVKPMSNDTAHAMTYQGFSAVTMCILRWSGFSPKHLFTEAAFH
jgi:hypothetical protein